MEIGRRSYLSVWLLVSCQFPRETELAHQLSPVVVSDMHEALQIRLSSWAVLALSSANSSSVDRLDTLGSSGCEMEVLTEG